jgi:hypothetical protein
MAAQSNTDSVPPASSTSVEQALKPHAADDFDVVIWSGDVNYRVEGNRRVADAALEQNMVEVRLYIVGLMLLIIIQNSFKEV